MKNKLVSLIALPLFFVGCSVAPIVKEKPIQKVMPQRIKVVYQLEEAKTFCNCQQISLVTEVIDKYMEVFKIRDKILVEKLEEGYKNKDATKVAEIGEILENSLLVQEWITEQKNDRLSEGKNCGCYKNEL